MMWRAMSGRHYGGADGGMVSPQRDVTRLMHLKSLGYTVKTCKVYGLAQVGPRPGSLQYQKVGPGECCSPRRRISFSSWHEGVDFARHVVECHSAHDTSIRMCWMTLQDLVDVARHVVGCLSAHDTRVQMRWMTLRGMRWMTLRGMR
jgi:hypothetical protein